jgi:DNA-binding FrmR family transcriptional regulator
MPRAPEIDGLVEGRWGLERARKIARQMEGDRRAVRALVEAMFGEDPELLKRAADVARRITERDAEPLERYADELAGLLAEVPIEESRTRWHLGLVVARVAHTREQRLRAARLMQLLMDEESNVVRCSAVEGIGQLAAVEPSLRAVAEEIITQSLREGTCAMKVRARHAKRRLEKTSGKGRSAA